MQTPLILTINLLFISVIFIALLVVVVRRRRQQERKFFVRGIGYIKTLRSLLAYIQQHRGLTAGFINGNDTARQEIEFLSQNILLMMGDMEASGKWLSRNVKWASLVDHWSRVKLLYLQGDAEKNFKQHNVLIANLLYLIDDIADAHHLTKITGDVMETDWRYLLSIAEYIGQARALGTGVAVKGECSSVLRIQLNHLRTKIASSIDSAWPEQSRIEIHYFLHCIETRLIVENPSIQAADYFKLATNCIEHVLNQFDQQIDQLDYERL